MGNLQPVSTVQLGRMTRNQNCRANSVHNLAVSRSSASQQVRLPLQWEREIEIACLASYVLTAMEGERDPDQSNAKVFSDEIIKQCRTRVIEGYLAKRLITICSYLFLPGPLGLVINSLHT